MLSEDRRIGSGKHGHPDDPCWPIVLLDSHSTPGVQGFPFFQSDDQAHGCIKD